MKDLIQCSYCIETCHADQLVNGCCQKCQERSFRGRTWKDLIAPIVAAIILTLAWIAWGTPSARASLHGSGFHSGTAILQYCEAPKGSFESGICLGYIVGISDSLSTEDAYKNRCARQLSLTIFQVHAVVFADSNHYRPNRNGNPQR